MNIKRNWARTWARNWVFLAAMLFAMSVATSLGAQSQPSLQITSPLSGTIVNPGQTLSVSVISPSGTAFSQVDIISEQPIGMSTSATSVPAQLSIAIPTKDIRIGQYMLTAEGITASGQNVESPSIAIDVERADPPISVSISDPAVILESLGKKIPLDVTATFGDGGLHILHVKESTLVTYSSSNIAVATVDALGNVTAVGPGNAQVMATYTLGSQSFPASVPVTVQNARLSVSSTSLSFGNQPVGTSSTPQRLALTDTATGNVTIQSVTASGDFSETDNCIASSPLTPGNGCTVNVTFSPTAGGARTGTLNISNSANIVPVGVSLSGTGTTTPYITSLNPTSGSVGTSVAVTGVNFGATLGKSTVTFNGTATKPKSWSDTSIVAPVPTGAMSGNVMVTEGGIASNRVGFTVVAPPTP